MKWKREHLCDQLNPTLKRLRSTREQSERVITSCFKGLTDHQPIRADYDRRCDRCYLDGKPCSDK